ncbi:MAG: helix-turn-helix domain-containing protein [Oscillospiraceae bacterium]|nr:helix-turn-helix domain-containing protein [Oscillospiraceae bacterium]
MIGYIQAEEAAKRWNISIRQIQNLCKTGRIDGAVKFGTTWAVPETAEKPTRTGKGKPGRKTKTSEVN